MNYDNISTMQDGFDYSQAGSRYVSIHIAPPIELSDKQLIEALAHYWKAPERSFQETRAKLTEDLNADTNDEDFETIRAMHRRQDLLEEQRRRVLDSGVS